MLLFRVSALVILASTVTLSACNTVAGAGKDMSSAGSAVANTANDEK